MSQIYPLSICSVPPQTSLIHTLIEQSFSYSDSCRLWQINSHTCRVWMNNIYIYIYTHTRTHARTHAHAHTRTPILGTPSTGLDTGFAFSRLWRLNNAQLVLRGPKCAKKYPPHHYITSSSLNRWDKAGWIHAFVFFMTNADPTIWMSQQKSRLIRPGNAFQYSIVQFWWACVNCILSFLFLADRSGTRCGLLLL